MGLVQNLKKKFNNWVDITLAELCSAYIKQLAKQTSKKRDNSFLMEYSLNHLATEHRSTTIVISSQDTSEKTIMKLDKTDEVVDKVRDWSVDRMENVETVGDKIALYEEFEEWIELDGEDSIEIMSFGTKTIDKGDKKR